MGRTRTVGLSGAALVRFSGLNRVLGVFYGLAAALTGFMILREFGLPSVPPVLEEWMYPVVQPLARALIGVWLWREMPGNLLSRADSQAPYGAA